MSAEVNSFIGSKLRIEVAEAGSEDMRRLKTAAESRRFPIFTKGGGKEAFSGDETKRKKVGCQCRLLRLGRAEDRVEYVLRYADVEVY